MKTIKRILWLCLIVLVIVAGVQIKGGYDKYQNAIKDRPLVEVIGALQSKENYTQYEDVPEIYYKALVAVEDRRFYKHNGFDFIGTTRAIYNDLKSWELLEGGSTISQQLAKNIYFPQDDTLERKIAEIFMAMKIEKEYEKEDVLEFYINAIYYGSGYDWNLDIWSAFGTAGSLCMETADLLGVFDFIYGRVCKSDSVCNYI